MDSILSERVTAEAAQPLGMPAFPVVAYGLTPYFLVYPGTISLRTETYVRLIRDILDGLARSGFRRILLCNGHGGNAPVAGLAQEWMADHPGCRVRFHNWWNAPRTLRAVQDTDPVVSHASWMENLPWTRLANLRGPETAKPMADLDRLRLLSPEEVRSTLGDGSFGGLYQQDDNEMRAIWQVAVDETRALIEGPWG